ncbi:MAG: valine--tRNA ligase [Candidatus Gottesmanbacteria bacterium]|nr:valine--tRNA ligase [Candidatus Gottesmanbacteria bacterium]
MDKAYNPQAVEEAIYKMWETGGYFTPKLIPKEALPAGRQPFSILLPPPNANADLHVGHAMYVVEDIMIRYHRMKGDPTLWMPGADHAGFETQYVYEKHLAKQGKSRFDFDRETLYKDIWNFVHTNRGSMENQLRRLGFSLDWSRNVFTLDPSIVETVYKSFKQLFDEGLVYRDKRLVNYCTKDGTGFSDLEVLYVERNDPLYYIKYGPFTIATARPETKFRDTALAVNPKDKRYKKYIGQTLEIMGLLGPITMTVIPDPHVDPKFGTGIMKVTPAHDPHDFELGRQFNLPVTPIIDFRGKMDFSWFLSQKDIDPKYRARAENYHGKKVAIVRPLMVEDLKADGLMIKIDEAYTHRIGTCWKCGTVIEPLPLEQWYVKVAPMTKKAIEAINKKQVTFVPKRFEKTAKQWLTNFHDWNISRQNVWGIRIPAWHCALCAQNPTRFAKAIARRANTTNKSNAQSIRLSGWVVTDGEKPETCPTCGGRDLTQDTDTFDTWFSSGQWPFATLRATRDFDYFYPTTVMETGYDILPWWVCRMLMLGIHLTGSVPFTTVYLHGLVRDAQGQKMSKSKGNVINPLKMVDQYGADALRMALVFGTGAGNDQALSEDKIRGMRNFANKLWNIGRFIEMNLQISNPYDQITIYDENMHKMLKNPNDKRIISQTNMLVAGVTKDLDRYRFSDAAQKIYNFTWHTLADVHLEKNKERFKEGDGQAIAVLRHVFLTIMKLLHPFMPFVTEEIWSKLPRKTTDPLIISPWPGN